MPGWQYQSTLCFIFLMGFNYEYVCMCMGTCFSQCSIAGKVHHDYDSSHTGKHLIGAYLQLQRLSPLSAWREA